MHLRFFTVYGPSQRPDLAIYRFFDGISNARPIVAFGNGDTFRDYTFIDDIVDGIEKAIKYDSTIYEVFNLGCGAPITLKKLIMAIEKVCKKKALIKWIHEQPGDVQGTFADISKARKLLDYQPKTRLATGLLTFHKWLLSTKKKSP